MSWAAWFQQPKAKEHVWLELSSAWLNPNPGSKLCPNMGLCPESQGQRKSLDWSYQSAPSPKEDHRELQPPWRQGWGCSCCCKCLLSRPLPPMCNCNCFQGRELRCVFLQSQSWLYILTTLSKKRCLFVFLSFSTLKFRSRNPRRKECPWSKTH